MTPLRLLYPEIYCPHPALLALPKLMRTSLVFSLDSQIDLQNSANRLFRHFPSHIADDDFPYELVRNISILEATHPITRLR